uniref:Uncharacterized protein n=1 Tax=Angiostrongylus cantonensis TaxID=6313 RepID=A0A0K0CST0_ANGCA
MRLVIILFAALIATALSGLVKRSVSPETAEKEAVHKRTTEIGDDGTDDPCENDDYFYKTWNARPKRAAMKSNDSSVKSSSESDETTAKERQKRSIDLVSFESNEGPSTVRPRRSFDSKSSDTSENPSTVRPKRSVNLKPSKSHDDSSKVRPRRSAKLSSSESHETSTATKSKRSVGSDTTEEVTHRAIPEGSKVKRNVNSVSPKSLSSSESNERIITNLPPAGSNPPPLQVQQ